MPDFKNYNLLASQNLIIFDIDCLFFYREVMCETKQHVILVILKVTTGNILFTVHRWCHTFKKNNISMRLQRDGT